MPLFKRIVTYAAVVGLYLLAVSVLQPQVFVPLPVHERVTELVPVGDEIWLGTKTGAFRVDRKGNQAQRVAGVRTLVFAIVPVGEEVWLGTIDGVFGVDPQGPHAPHHIVQD